MQADTSVKETDYSKAILDGEGENDYTRYMKTDVLLNLQRHPDQQLHRDELLFQIVHQSTELWLKLSCNELGEATRKLADHKLEDATSLTCRSAFAIHLITGQLEMLKFMTPWDFQGVRPALGHGSGLESPGWRAVKEVGAQMCEVFDALLADLKVDLPTIYREHRNGVLFNLCEALVEWDENVALWRARHFKVAIRTIGHNSIGTKGMMVDKLTHLLNMKFFPGLWEVRSTLSSSATQS